MKGPPGYKKYPSWQAATALSYGQEDRYPQWQVLTDESSLSLLTPLCRFHADEALACALLRMLPEYTDASVTRTRDYALLEAMDVVVDVGGVYDPATHRYDHHQV